MGDDYSRACASPRTITLAGKDYLVSKFGPRDIGDLQSWLKDQIPDPRKEAKELMHGLPDVVALEVWKDAVARAKDWPPMLDSEQGKALVSGTYEGQARCLFVALRKHNQGFDLNAARALADLISLDELKAVLELAGPEQSPPKAEAEMGTGAN